MNWEKQNLDEIDEILENLNKVKVLAKEKLKEQKDRLSTIVNEIPEYVDLYKKMKGE
jgi:ligand-binding sensor protein